MKGVDTCGLLQSPGSIAKLLERPKTTAHRMLPSLALAGAIRLVTGPMEAVLLAVVLSIRDLAFNKRFTHACSDLLPHAQPSKSKFRYQEKSRVFVKEKVALI
jgi:hypothetical protein